ncbi:hypothetical protein HGI10_66910 [Streptomyces collinus]|nr:hypothetical protein HGI10_66910 [Streptomyces collinus]
MCAAHTTPYACLRQACVLRRDSTAHRPRAPRGVRTGETLDGGAASHTTAAGTSRFSTPARHARCSYGQLPGYAPQHARHPGLCALWHCASRTSHHVCGRQWQPQEQARTVVARRHIVAEPAAAKSPDRARGAPGTRYSRPSRAPLEAATGPRFGAASAPLPRTRQPRASGRPAHRHPDSAAGQPANRPGPAPRPRELHGRHALCARRRARAPPTCAPERLRRLAKNSGAPGSRPASRHVCQAADEAHETDAPPSLTARAAPIPRGWHAGRADVRPGCATLPAPTRADAIDAHAPRPLAARKHTEPEVARRAPPERAGRQDRPRPRSRPRPGPATASLRLDDVNARSAARTSLVAAARPHRTHPTDPAHRAASSRTQSPGRRRP